LELFEENASIYNDILPANQPQQLSPKDYFDKFTQSVKMNYAEYRNLKFQFPTPNGEKWEIKCSFSKDIRFKSQTGNYYPKWSFNYTVTIEMDKNYNQTYKIYENAKIKSIEVATRLSDFFIIENKEDLTVILDSAGDVIQDWDNDYRSRLFPKDDYNINNFKITISENQSNYFYTLEKKWTQNQSDEHFYYPEYHHLKKNIFGIGVNYSPFAFGNKISNTNAENFKDIQQRSNSLSLSFFFGKQIAHKKNTTWFFNVILDLNRYYYEYNGTNYTEYQDIDADNDPYLRKITINSLNEQINTFSVSIPLSVQFLIQITKSKKNPLFFSFELGALAEYTLYSKNKYNLNVNYHGLYDYYGGVEFDHYYDYGNFDVSGKQKLATVKDLQYNYGVFSKIGLWLALNETNLLKFNIAYKHCFKAPLKYKENFVLSENRNRYESLLQGVNQNIRNIFVELSWISTINSKR
jgi:hypothetical protein